MIGQTLTLDITDLHDWGFGVGQSADYGRIYVPFTFPGERVTVTLTEKVRNSQWLARLNEPRGLDFCVQATRCGGCLWPGIDYATQLGWKKNLLVRAARSLPAIMALPITVHASEKVSGVRNRIHLHANFFNGRFEFGFFARGTRSLIPVADCPMAEDAIRTVLAKLAALRDKEVATRENFGFGIELIHCSADASLVQMVIYASPARRAELARVLPFFTTALHFPVTLHDPESTAAPEVWQRLPDFTYYTRPGCFQQGNTAQATVIRDLIGAELLAAAPGVLFDLYSGSGNYSLAHHRLVTQIYGVDENRIGVEVAALNIERNRVANAVFHCGSVAETLAQRPALGWPERADTVIIDPARWGMGGQVVAELARLRPGKIIYVSNNTASFVRDAKALLRVGFQPTALHLVDFFPNTPHFDTVTVWG